MACRFVPPYLLCRLSSSGDDGRGARTLRVDQTLRSRRHDHPTLLRPGAPAGQGTRVVHDAGGAETLPGTPVRRDGDLPTDDVAVDEAFAYAGEVWDLFALQFDRRSVDGRASPLVVTVHYGQDYDIAFWDGQQLVFRDGDGTVFDRFTSPRDVMAHEFTHAVTQFTAALTYQGQSGALNESVSGAVACMAKQRALGQTADQADWLIGEGLFLPGINARALRSMTEPGTAYDDPRLVKDPQVASMADYVDSTDDNGGVHIDSGIPNRAFALAALALGGHSWKRAGRLWYDALTAGEVTAGTDFAGFARATVSSAGLLFPEDPAVAQQVSAAWTTVGVLAAPELAPARDAAQSPAGAGRVSVRRSGGFGGLVRDAELDLDVEPVGAEVRSLLAGMDLQGLDSSPAGADRFVYTLEFSQHRVTLGELDLTPELHQVVRLVLGEREGALPPGGVEL